MNSEEIKKILNLKGRVRGDVLFTDIKYIERISGPEARKKVEEELMGMDEDIDFKKMNKTGWYPIGWKVLILLLTREVMNWADQDLVDMGRFASKESFILKTLLRYFVSLDKTFRESERFWLNYWRTGTFVPYKLNEKEKYLIMQLKDFEIHPDLCLYFVGHFESIANLILKSDKIFVEERKCSFRGDDFHEFMIKWE